MTRTVLYVVMAIVALAALILLALGPIGFDMR
jgi:hypothetical protein